MEAVERTDGIKFVFARKFKEVDEYPLSDSLPFLVCLVAAYLLFVKKIGPDFMKNREPYKLKNTILVYNAIQVVLSAVFVYLSFIALLKGGLFPKQCCEEDPEIRKTMLKAMFIYFLGKISELLDTIFFVLRKKYNQVSFLHVYHHASVVIGTWMMFKYSVNQTAVYAGFINSFIHVIMYFYYFVAALGPQYQKYLTWKRHITSLQLIQFVSIHLHQLASIFFGRECTHSLVGILYVLPSTILFFYLFYQFYKKSYNKPAVSQKESNGTAQEDTKFSKTKDNIVANGLKTKTN
ncbi:very long chain fatty acid elongase 7-like isoform X1 [Ostrinia nubilalis]|uniref:very long chain fatty acid elongase 7-like isoform X1 n=1 Tax=Ostrinia nubilalis TaxID=29057 RepID=UPI0030822A57